MKAISKVIKFNDRKFVEIPKNYRDQYDIGEKVYIEKTEEGKNERTNERTKSDG